MCRWSPLSFAIAAARRAQPAWFALGWEKRIEILTRDAELRALERDRRARVLESEPPSLAGLSLRNEEKIWSGKAEYRK